MFSKYIAKHKYSHLQITLVIIALSVFSSVLFYLPFLLKFTQFLGLHITNPGTDYIYRHFDGPFYLVAAKTFYNPDLIKNLHLESSLSPAYFAAHLPLYPFFVKMVASVVGYLKSLIVVNLFFTAILAVVFYSIVRKFALSSHPFLLTVVSLFLPRFLVVRSVGAPESLFMLCIVLSLFFFECKKYFLAGIFGAFSVMTKSPGVLLFIAYILVIIETFMKTKKIQWQWTGILLVPVGLLVVFIMYAVQYNDFLAYFHSGDNIHLVFPYAAFNYQKTWVGTAWLEDIIFYFALYLSSVVLLKESKYRSFYYFGLVFLTATIFVQHRDISRYSLPLWPLACIAFEKHFTSKKFLIVFLVLLPAIYLYAWNFALFNVLPISDWKPYL